MRRVLAASKHYGVGSLFCLLTIAQVGSAWAEDAGATQSLDSVLQMMNLKAAPGNTPDFVRASRPTSEPDFLPVGKQHPKRSVKVKSAAEIKASEAELDSARLGHDKLAGRKQPAGTPQPPLQLRPKSAKN